MLVKICQGFAPSTRAASASSRGIDRKNWRRRNVPKAPPSHAPTHSGSEVPMKLPLSLNGLGRDRHRMKLGTRTTWNGMIMVARSTPNSGPLPRNGITAKAYAAMEQVTSCPAVHSRASLSELTKNVPNVTPWGNAFHMFA